MGGVCKHCGRTSTNSAAQSEVREKVRLSGRFLTSLRPDSYRDSWGLFLLVTFLEPAPTFLSGDKQKKSDNYIRWDIYDRLSPFASTILSFSKSLFFVSEGNGLFGDYASLSALSKMVENEQHGAFATAAFYCLQPSNYLTLISIFS